VTLLARVIVVLLACAVVGCGGSGESAPGTSHSLTPETVETQIRALQEHAGIQLESVHCPRNVKIRNGETFKCVTTQTNGGRITTTVKPTNTRLGEATYDFRLPPGT
jgi:hypothetical protein